MKKFTLILILLFSCTLITAQKKKKEKYEDILKTTDIKKIEAFLQTAHPEDPRRTVLKPKLISLKNSAWTEGRKDAKPMEARYIVTDIPKSFINKPHSNESEEFTKLMMETSSAKKEKTVKLLNQLFDNDVTNKEAIVLIQNNSDCNMIVRLKGSKLYNMAIPAHGENSLVIEKDNYELTSNVCDSKYIAQKEIKKSMMLILNNPVVKLNSPTTQHQNKAQK